MATLVVSALLWGAVTARFTLIMEEPARAPVMLSEIAAPQTLSQAGEPEPPPRPEPHQDQLVAAPLPTPSVAPVYSGEPLEVSNPVWLTRPPNPERFYPRAAFMRGVEGRVTLACFVEIDGRLTCTIEEEAPIGQGFGDAALAIAHAHVMQPATINGAPVRARYRMMVPFSVD